MVRTCIGLVVVALAGCGFTSLPSEDEMGDVDPGPGDPADGDPIARKCSTADTSLELCVDFEDGNGTSLIPTDGSGKNRVIALAEDIDFMQRGTSPNVELAGQLTASSRLQVSETSALDITQNLTMSMWIKPADASRVNPGWLLDNNTQYAMSIQPDGQIRCGLGPDTVDSSLSLIDLEWHHIACSYDGTTLKVYVDGAAVGCRSVEKTIASGGMVGTSIGSNIGGTTTPTFTEPFVGGLDNVQVFSRTLTDQQLCTAAGYTTCGNYCGGED